MRFQFYCFLSYYETIIFMEVGFLKSISVASDTRKACCVVISGNISLLMMKKIEQKLKQFDPLTQTKQRFIRKGKILSIILDFS